MYKLIIMTLICDRIIIQQVQNFKMTVNNNTELHK